MAYSEHGMWEILHVLRRIHAGEGKRQVARATGRSRTTVTRYLTAAMDLGWVPGKTEPDEILAREVAAVLKPGPKDASPGEMERLLLPHKDRIKVWLADEGRGLKLSKVWQLLTRDGIEVSYISLYRFALKHAQFGGKKLTVRLPEVAPGEVAEVDFGRLGLVMDPEAGKRRLAHALVVTLVHSRHQYVHVTHHQRVEDLINGLEDAWEFFGGVTARVIIDNLKAAVTTPDWYAPVFQRTFEEYARHRGFVIDAAGAGEPTHKPHVERGVSYVRENFFRGEEFLSFEHLQREAVRWCRDTAGMRVHGTTRRQPLVVFNEVERAALKPLTRERFDIPRWATVRVHPDCHIRFGNALYSVPFVHRGKDATVRGDSHLVHIYVANQLVKTHPVGTPGARLTDYHDYPQEKTAYAMRDANYQIRRARERGEQIGAFAAQLLAGTYPWAHLRQSQKLLRLADKYGNAAVNEACGRALAFGIINVRRVERIVQLALESSRAAAGAPGTSNVVQLPLRFLREPGSFTHPHVKETTDGKQPVP
jgi:transposase